MKKYLILSFSFLILCFSLSAQIKDPVKFKTTFSSTPSGDGELVLTGVATTGWHIYSTDLPSKGPTSAAISLDSLKGAELIGKLTPGSGEVEEYDNVFDLKLRFFEKRATFVQKIKITEPENYIIKGYLTFGACNNENCLPPTQVPFTFIGKAVNPADVGIMPDAKGSGTTDLEKAGFGKYWKPVIDDLYMNGEESVTTDHTWLYIFAMGFLGGLLALLTPCVWPIIPMTVSFFLKRNSTRKKGIREAWIYGVSIVVIYLSLGLAITFIFGASTLNALATNAFFNLLFFFLLILFALSFFGLFEITLPARWSTAVDSKAERSTGILSIFLMAFTLSLVSFSCTGPIIGFLLVEVSTVGNILGPAIGMFGFALALALPFTIFALFPSWLNSAPKSGGWMTSFKVILGFIEFAFAFKFLSVADLAYGWGILDREAFLMIWILLALLLGLYLLGIIRMKNEVKRTKISVIRKIMGIVSFVFAAYMIPGLWGAPCTLVSAFAPPMYTQTWNIYHNDVHAKFEDYDKGMEYAATVGKPVMLDFTGYGCVNCRKMESAVWTDPKVSKIINEDYILIALFVDNKTPLDKQISIYENGIERKLRTLGDKWSFLQRIKFGANAQPFYVLVDNNGYLLTKPRAYDQNVDAYIKFLQDGLDSYNKP